VRVEFDKRTLPNGLDVVVHEDHRVPLVAVSVWYHVGSRNERPGKTGLAHLFEHLMFEGSAHQPKSYFEPLQAVGAAVNGSTGADRTDYWEVVPSEAARRALWMEADRMGWLLPVLTETRFEAQRGVVINERRQSYENRPYGLAHSPSRARFTPRTTHMPGRPLARCRTSKVRRWTTRGRSSRNAYHPGNASLVIAGDLTAAAAFEWADELFGAIPGGPSVPPVDAPPVSARPGSTVLEDRVDLPRLYLSWPSPRLFAPGDADLDLAADLIANGRTSRLYRRLIHDKRVATEIMAHQSSRELGGLFQIVASAAPDTSLGSVHHAIVDELDSLRSTGPDEDELSRGRAQAEAAFVYRVQALGGFGGRADQLNAYNVYLGQPDWFDADLARYLDATRASVQSALQDWIDPPRRRPVGRAGGPAGSGGWAVSRFLLPPVGAPSRSRSCRAAKRAGQWHRVWSVEHSAVPAVTVAMVMDGGTADRSADRPGLASLVSSLMTEGAGGRDAIAMADALARIGGHLSVEPGADLTTLTLTMLARHFETGIGLLADIVRRPALTAPDFDRVRDLRRSRLIQASRTPGSVADRALLAAVFRDHPYGHGALGTSRTADATTVDDVRREWAASWTPARATLVIAGDVAEDRALAAAGGVFGGWAAPEAARPPLVCGTRGSSHSRRRSPRIPAVRSSRGAPRPAAADAGLPCVAHPECHAWRSVHQPDQPQSPRGSRDYLRRAVRVRHATGGRAVFVRDQRAGRCHGRGGG
jgi:zinc protease